MKRIPLQRKLVVIQLFFLFVIGLDARPAHGQKKEALVTSHECIAENVPDKKEINVFLSDLSWAPFDPEVGYILGNYMPHDGLDMS